MMTFIGRTPLPGPNDQSTVDEIKETASAGPH